MVLKNRATTTSQCVAMHHATSNALIAALAMASSYRYMDRSLSDPFFAQLCSTNR